MMKNNKTMLIILILISVILTACSVDSYEGGSNGNKNSKEKDTNVSEEKDINEEEKNEDERANDMEPYSIVIDRIQNKATKLVGNIVYDENFNGICEVTGTDSELVSVSIDEDSKNINITSNNRYLDTSGNLVIKLGVPIKAIKINQGKFNLDISLDSLEQFHGVFECAINGEIRSNNVKEFKLDLLGAGNVHLTGNAEDSNILIQGSSIVEGKEMEVKDVKVKLEGVGSCSVYASDSLDAYVEGIGSITYYGNPDSVDKEVDGLGVIKEGD